MAKVQIKSEKLTPFGGIFSIMEQFDALLAQTIDSTTLPCSLVTFPLTAFTPIAFCVSFVSIWSRKRLSEEL